MIQENKEHDKIYKIVKRCMSRYDYLDPLIFDGNQLMHEDIRNTLLNTASFLEEYLRDMVPDLVIDDVILQGGASSYVREADCDIDVQLICHSPSVKDEVLRSIIKIAVSYMYHGLGLYFSFKGREVDYLAFPIIDGINTGVYSVQNNKWITKSICKEFSFSADELYEMVIERMERHENFINSLPRSKSGTLPLDECKKLNDFVSSIPSYFRNKAAYGDREYEMEYQMFRVLKKSGETRNLREFYTKVYNEAISKS